MGEPVRFHQPTVRLTHAPLDFEEWTTDELEQRFAAHEAGLVDPELEDFEWCADDGADD